MRVYDLDGTILHGDSEQYFFEYCFKNIKLSRKSRYKFRFYGWLNKKLKFNVNFTRPRQYYFLREIIDIDTILKEFWDQHEKYVKDFYLKDIREDDIISTASPKFLEEELMKRLGIKNLIGTDLDKHTGKLTGKFNYKEEKVKSLIRFTHEIPDEFYSDSKSDTPLARYSKKAYFVKGELIEEWDFNK